MKINTDDIKTNGAHEQGCMVIKYRELVEIFGQPRAPLGEDSDAEWDIEFDDGAVCTIYNWRNGRRYLGPKGPTVEQIELWQIGGHKLFILFSINRYINEAREARKALHHG